MSVKTQLLSATALVMLLSTSAFARWTAIAYDASTHKWGRAQCSFTYEEAVNTALEYCDAGCQIVAYAEDGFVSLATSPGGAWGTGSLHDSQYDAEAASLDRCRLKDENCSTLVDGFAYNCP